MFRRPRAFGGGRIFPLTSIDGNGIAPPWSRLMKDIWKFQRDSSKKSAAASQFRRLAFQFQTAAFGKLRKRPERPEWGALPTGSNRPHFGHSRHGRVFPKADPIHARLVQAIESNDAKPSMSTPHTSDRGVPS